MTKEEYEYIQKRLTKLIDTSQYLRSKKEEAYAEGVLSAKSVIKEIYTYHNINANQIMGGRNK